MSIYAVLQIVMTVSIVILVAFVIIVLMQLKKTLTTIDDLAGNINSEIIPLLSKAQTTLDEINSELERVDGIVSTFQEVSDKVQNSTDIAKGMARKVVATPVVKIAGLASGARTAINNIVSRRQK